MKNKKVVELAGAAQGEAIEVFGSVLRGLGVRELVSVYNVLYNMRLHCIKGLVELELAKRGEI